VLAAADVERALRQGGAHRVAVDVPPRFQAGDRVRARTINPLGHTRLPRYARGREGTIARDYGVFVFPDTHAHGLGPAPQHLYSVRFTARELWGPTAPAGDAVYLDMWDGYLDPA
jgi:nitrile hydratase